MNFLANASNMGDGKGFNEKERTPRDVEKKENR